MADHEELTFTMTLDLTVEEAKSLDQAYREGLTVKGYPVYSTDAPDHPTIGKPGYPTREEAAEYADTLLYLNSLIENIHVASVQHSMRWNANVWEDTPQPVSITVQQWRTLREALADKLAIYETAYRNGSGPTFAMEYRGLIAKFDALTLAVHVAEAAQKEEARTTVPPANEVT